MVKGCKNQGYIKLVSTYCKQKSSSILHDADNEWSGFEQTVSKGSGGHFHDADKGCSGL